MNAILIAIISMTGLGIFFAAILAIADKTMSVKEDERVATVENILPGLNCGACGYVGCYSFAMALVKGGAPVDGCLPGGADTATDLAEYLGLEKKTRIKSIAVLHCNADCTQRLKLADYKGIETCNAASRIFGGGLACAYGCLGYGDCERICPTGAVRMANGLAVINSTKCISCGKCVKACPRNLYSIEKFMNDNIVAVACSSRYKCAEVRKVCGVGCVACKLCEKLSGGVFEVDNNLAVIHYDRAKTDTGWDKTIEKCPTKVIVKIT